VEIQVNIEPEKNASLLAPLADEYPLTQADAHRITAKLEALLAQDLTSTSAEPLPASAGGAGGTAKGKGLLLVGLSCVALAITGALALRESPTVPAAAPTITSPHSTAPRPSDSPREVEAASAIPAISVDALPTAPSAQPADKVVKKAVASVSTSEVPTPKDTLADEARLLGDARRALKGGDGAGALALLDEHARAFPRGWLADERSAERVVVLCRLGRDAEAVREAAAFLEGRPKNPLTHRVETSCAGTARRKTGE
jgi:hypothetical protein